LEEQIQKIPTIPEIQGEGNISIMPVIPIKRDKAMAALTDTEVVAIEFLSAEGPKTAPEIKEKINLSRVPCLLSILQLQHYKICFRKI